MLVQFLLSVILLLALIVTWRRAKQNAIRRIEAFGWSIVWIGATVVIWKPNAATVIANALGIGRGADFVLYAAVIVLLILVFHLHVAHDRLERQLTELVRRDALRAFDHKA